MVQAWWTATNNIESWIAWKKDYAVWWDRKGVMFFELIPRNQTINSNVYHRQLNQLNATVKEKRPELVNRKGVIFHHNYATPHTSLASRKKLFWSLQNTLNGKTFNDNEAVKSHLVQFLADKDQKFYEHWIMKLPERWQKVTLRKYIWLNQKNYLFETLSLM